MGLYKTFKKISQDKVQKGDSLWDLGIRSREDIQRFADANPDWDSSDPDAIYPGMTIPGSSEESTVQRGDSLWGLGITSPEDIQRFADANPDWDSSDPNLIYPGMTIPGSPSEPAISVQDASAEYEGRPYVDESSDPMLSGPKPPMFLSVPPPTTQSTAQPAPPVESAVPAPMDTLLRESTSSPMIHPGQAVPPHESQTPLQSDSLIDSWRQAISNKKQEALERSMEDTIIPENFLRGQAYGAYGRISEQPTIPDYLLRPTEDPYANVSHGPLIRTGPPQQMETSTAIPEYLLPPEPRFPEINLPDVFSLPSLESGVASAPKAPSTEISKVLPNTDGEEVAKLQEEEEARIEEVTGENIEMEAPDQEIINAEIEEVPISDLKGNYYSHGLRAFMEENDIPERGYGFPGGDVVRAILTNFMGATYEWGANGTKRGDCSGTWSTFLQAITGVGTYDCLSSELDKHGNPHEGEALGAIARGYQVEIEFDELRPGDTIHYSHKGDPAGQSPHEAIVFGMVDPAIVDALGRAETRDEVHALLGSNENANPSVMMIAHSAGTAYSEAAPSGGGFQIEPMAEAGGGSYQDLFNETYHRSIVPYLYDFSTMGDPWEIDFKMTEDDYDWVSGHTWGYQ